MSLDLEQDDPIDYDSDEDGGCDNLGDLGLQTQRVVHNVGRSLDEILQLEIDLINSNTEFTPEEWIDRYAKRFRELLTDDPTLTEFQVKHALYLNY